MISMIRGTTPTHIFELPFQAKILDEVKVSYAQAKEVVVEKDTEDCTLEENTITVKLTQEETLRFSPIGNVDVQLKVKTSDSTVLATRAMRVNIEDILNEEVFV